MTDGVLLVEGASDELDVCDGGNVALGVILGDGDCVSLAVELWLAVALDVSVTLDVELDVELLLPELLCVPVALLLLEGVPELEGVFESELEGETSATTCNAKGQL